MNFGFSRQISEKNNQISKFMQIPPVGADLFRAEGRTDIMKLTVAFCKFENAPETTLLNRSLEDWQQRVNLGVSQKFTFIATFIENPFLEIRYTTILLVPFPQISPFSFTWY
jgi:hypothetical protein